MTQDIIERLTSKLFEHEEFSDLVLKLCRVITREQEFDFCKRLSEVTGLRPKQVGISPYLTLDDTCMLEQIYKELHP